MRLASEVAAMGFARDTAARALMTARAREECERLDRAAAAAAGGGPPSPPLPAPAYAARLKQRAVSIMLDEGVKPVAPPHNRAQ